MRAQLIKFFATATTTALLATGCGTQGKIKEPEPQPPVTFSVKAGKLRPGYCNTVDLANKHGAHLDIPKRCAPQPK